MGVYLAILSGVGWNARYHGLVQEQNSASVGAGLNWYSYNAWMEQSKNIEANKHAGNVSKVGGGRGDLHSQTDWFAEG